MTTLLILFLGQCVFAVVVIFVLKKLLDKELTGAALEKFESCKQSPEIKEITVRSASNLSDEFKSRLESVKRRKFMQADLNYQQDTALKGGVVILVGDLLLDFSLSNRLHNFWT